LSKFYNPLIVSFIVSSEDVGRWLIQILYDNYNGERFISALSLSKALGIDESVVIDELKHLMKSNLVETNGCGYMLSLKGYEIAHQRVTSFCPHL